MREKDRVIYSNARRIYSHYIKRERINIDHGILAEMLVDKDVLSFFKNVRHAIKSFNTFKNKRTFTSREVIYQEYILYIYGRRTTENPK